MFYFSYAQFHFQALFHFCLSSVHNCDGDSHIDCQPIVVHSNKKKMHVLFNLENRARKLATGQSFNLNRVFYIKKKKDNFVFFQQLFDSLAVCCTEH